MRKKKDNGLRAIICLAVATVAIGGASIALSQMDKTVDNVETGNNSGNGNNTNSGNQGGNENQSGNGNISEVSGGTPLDVSGASAKIKEARQNEDGTYTVVIIETGFGGEMQVVATYSADGQTLISYDVPSHGETPGFGAKVNEEEYKKKLAGVKLPITTAGLDISAILGVAEDKTEAPETQPTEEAGLKDGEYRVQAEPDEKGNYAFVTVTVENGKITSVVWDEMYGGELKSVLSAEGKYVMKPIWKTQAERLGKYVVENQGTKGLMNAEGRTDVVSGVSIRVGGFVDLADQAIAKADGKDGTYKVEGTPDEKGNYGMVTVTVADGKITEVLYDEMYGGELKSVLSAEGKYVMKPIWKTQAEAAGAYVVENQSTAGLVNENGKTDVVSGVSITVAGFADLVNQALAQASETGEVPAVEVPKAPLVEATKVDIISGATISSKAVIRAIDEGFVYLRDFVLNK